MNIETIGGTIIESSCDKISNDIKQYTNLRLSLQEWLMEKGKKLDEVLPKLEEFLNTQKFSIESVEHITKSGGGPTEIQVKEDDELIVNLRLKMIKGRRPVTAGWDSYRKDGSSYACPKVRAIVYNVNEAFKQKFNKEFFGLQINQYSLNKNSGILCTFWVK